MRGTVILGWSFSVAALTAMVIGHLGDHGLSWRGHQISTFAAAAPYDDFVSGSMLLSAGAIVVVGVLVSKHDLVGVGYWAHLVPPLAGASAAGLVMVASYEETAVSLQSLSQAGFWAIRLQSFHDAGLQVFFYGGVMLVTMLGMIVILSGARLVECLLGAIMLGLGPGSFLLMRTGWTKAIGLTGETIGLQQRAALMCLWLAMVCVLAIASSRLRWRNTTGGR